MNWAKSLAIKCMPWAPAQVLHFLLWNKPNLFQETFINFLNFLHGVLRGLFLFYLGAIPSWNCYSPTFFLLAGPLSLPCPGDFNHTHHLRNDCNVEHNTTCFLCSLSHPKYSFHLGKMKEFNVTLYYHVCLSPIPLSTHSPCPISSSPFLLQFSENGALFVFN